ncbi:MAG: hypothetical protein ACJAZ1_003366, partial [Yoonia sp.]
QRGDAIVDVFSGAHVSCRFLSGARFVGLLAT